MFLRPRVHLPVLFLLMLIGCSPFSRQPGVGPWNGGRAPAIEGADSLGQAMRLADYRGQVVLLSFWHGG